MTIEAEARATLPAGWYTDPGQSGSKRWWDGSKWTEHLQKVAPVATSTATKLTKNPYGLQGVVSAPRAPLSDEELAALPVQRAPKAYNGSGWLSLLFGAVAVGFTTLNALPVSQTLWVVGVAVIAFAWGIRAFMRRRSGSATITWAPVIGILLAIVATLSMFLGFGVMNLVSSNTPQTTATASATSVPSFTPRTSPEPLVFPSNAALTAEETAVQTLATSVNRSFAGGNATLGAGQAWPAAISMNGSTVEANGSPIATLPAGMSASLQLSTDKTSYHLSVTGSNVKEFATYDSGVNRFSWSCLATDTNCKPSN